jgi:hypothetical protein
VYLLLQGGDHPGGVAMNTLHDIKGSLLEVIREEPDITWPDIIRRTGLRPGEAWLGLSALRQEGRIKQSQNGWKVTDRAE